MPKSGNFIYCSCHRKSVLLEYLENVGYTVLGGGLAAISGLVVQWWHTRRELKKDIKKIHDILKPEFENQYRVLLDERQEVKKAKCRTEADFDYLKNNKAAITGYFHNVGSKRLYYLTWNAVNTSGNLIKLDNDEIQAIQFVHQSVIDYSDRMNRLQEMGLKWLVNEFSEKPIPMPEAINLHGVDILRYYVNNYEQRVEETLKAFETLNNLSWFDMTE